MNKFGELIKKNNTLDLLLILFFILVLYPIFFAKQSTYLVDYGREAYLPWQILNGEVLYKDIFNVYGPLGYQINALAYKLFGVNLGTLYVLGLLNSFVISSFVYLISRLFTERKISFCITSVVITYCVYSVGVHNLVMPYSFNAVYALSSSLISIYTMLLYLKEKKNYNLVFSFLFAGFAFANKVEYLPYFCFLFVALPFVVNNKKDWKSYLIPFSAFLIFPIISFGALLLQGVTVSDFVNAFVLMKKLLQVPATKYFYNAYGLYFNPYLFVWSVKFFIKLMLKLLPLAVLFYGLNFINFKFVKNKFLTVLFNVFIFLISVALLRTYIPQYNTFLSAFSWSVLLILAVSAGVAFYLLRNLYKKNKTDIKQNEIMYLFLCVSSILLSIKGFCHVSAQAYGTLALPVLLIPIYVLFVEYLTLLLKKINADIWHKTMVNITFMGLVIFLFTNVSKAYEHNYGIVNNSRGKITTWKCSGQSELINYIKSNTPKDARIVVMPEGVIINFLSERKSHNYYYYLMPVNVQVFGEDKIIEDFKKNPPDYFIVYNLPYFPYHEGTFEQFAPKITNYIVENYSVDYFIDDAIEFVMYKKKS